MANYKIDNYIETFTGIKFEFLNPKEEQIDIIDIAHSLSMQVRFTGHCCKFYSIAEHSLLVSELCPDEYKLYGLLHDASEAYLTDVASPIKPFLQNYKMMECKVMNAVVKKFNLPEFFPDEVHDADMLALRIEIDQLMKSQGKDWAINKIMTDPIPKLFTQGLTPEDAFTEFMIKFKELSK